MNNWKIENNLLSDLYLKMINSYPFSHLKHNRNTLNLINFETNRYKNIKICIEDYLKPRVVSVTQIIPIEELKHFAKKYDIFISSKCKKQPFVNQRDSISYFDNIGLWDDSWFHLGFAELINCNIVDNFTAYAYRLTDSFVQISFYFTISDIKRYEFYKLLKTNYDTKIVLLTKKHPILLRNQAMKIFGSVSLQNSKIYDYFNLLKNDITDLLRQNNLIFHIAKTDSISYLNVISFKKIHKYESTIHETFWNSFHLDKHFSFIDKKNQYYFPESMNFENDIGLLSNYIFVNDVNFELVSGFVNIEHQLRSELNDWGMNLIRGLAIKDVLNDHYQNISDFRMNYFNAKHNVRHLRKYHVFQTTNYWINLFSKEYLGLKKRAIAFSSPVLTIDRFYKQINILDLLNKNNVLKIKALNNLSSFIDMNINKFNDYRTLNINKKTQHIILCLTIITVVIGIIQISQIDFVSTFCNKISKFYTDSIDKIVNYIKNLTKSST